MHCIDVQAISKRYQQHIALSEVSLAMPEGCIYGLLGPNGAGKTTLIRILNQIIAPDCGQILFRGEALHPKHVSQIGYMPEERGLYKSMTVGEQCLYLAQLKGMPKAEAKVALQQWFDKFDMGAWWHKKVQELSKGMAQKVQFITTVLHRPPLLILDEPFSGFDPVNAALIRDEILALKAQGTSILFSTHRMDTVEDLCQHITLIHKSKTLLQGELNALKQQHRPYRYQIEMLSPTADFASWIQALPQAAPTVFDSLYGGQQWAFTLGHDRIAELLPTLMRMGQLVHLSEVMPSAQHLFIQTVTQADPTYA